MIQYNALVLQEKYTIKVSFQIQNYTSIFRCLEYNKHNKLVRSHIITTRMVYNAATTFKKNKEKMSTIKIA